MYREFESGEQISGGNVTNGQSGFQHSKAADSDWYQCDEEESIESMLHGILDVRKFLTLSSKSA